MNPDSQDGIDRDPGRPAYGRHRALSERLCRARIAHFGIDGVAELSRRLGVPERTWRHYEAGVTKPADVVLRFMEMTGVTACDLLQDSRPVGGGHPDLVGDVPDGTPSASKQGGTGLCREPPPSL